MSGRRRKGPVTKRKGLVKKSTEKTIKEPEEVIVKEVPNRRKKNINIEKLKHVLEKAHSKLDVEALLIYKYNSGETILENLSKEEFITLYKILITIIADIAKHIDDDPIHDFKIEDRQLVYFLNSLTREDKSSEFSNIIFGSPLLENERMEYRAEVALIQSRTLIQDTHIKCVNKDCGAMACYFVGTKQARSGDEAPAVLYQCMKCNKKFTR